MISRSKRCLCSMVLAVLVQAVAYAAPPAGYYDTVDTTNATTLRTTLHDVIKDHTRFPYTSTSTDTWDILELADEDPNNPNNILDVYKNASYPKQGGGNTYYQREHTWPKSYGFPIDSATNYPYTDCHMLHLSDGAYNGARSNKPYRNCDASCTEYATDVNNGQGGGSGSYPGNSNWASGSYTTGTWETWIGMRGDVARSLFYMDVRYEGGTNGNTGTQEPDLILTDNEALIDASNTGSNEPVAYMGMLSVLLQWSDEDPVDDRERNRNDVVFSFQGNRNPFIDHPEWVKCVFSGICGCSVNGDCDDGVFCNGAETCVSNVCQAGSDPCPGQNCDEGTQTCADCFNDPQCDDGLFCNGAETCVANVCQAGTDPCTPQTCNESTDTCGSGGGTGGNPWINELHYDNVNTDTGEFVEIAGPAGLNLAGWQVQGYNGNGGGTYSTLINLSGVIPDQGGCMGTLDFDFIPMQNGSPDGLALIDDTGSVIEFISYEGSFTAVGGPADGMTSVDIGVAESTSTPVGDSLQLAGTGSTSTDFTWQPEAPQTRGLPNTGQTFDGCGGCTGDGDCDDGLYCNGAETCNAGTCIAGTAPNCDDGVGCTDDACNEATDSCDNVANDANCDNGLWCDGAETCSATLDCQAGTAPNCDDGVGCTDDSCNETTDSCDNIANDANCDDGLFCNGAETCSATLDCQAGTAPNCSDGVGCTDDSCNETTDSCDHVANDANCDDGLFCNGAETCDPALDCQGGTDPCPGQACDEVGDVCVDCQGDPDCDDGLWCNGAETCVGGTCQAGTAPNCSDGVGCTDDSCNESTDSCDHVANDANCDNGLWCDGAETCSATLDCQAGTAPNCGDGVGCTDDSCNETTDSCDHIANDANCDNGLWCDGTETCNAALDCQAGTAPNCDDGVGCTDDSCIETTDSCDHVANDANCDNGLFCDGAETCDPILDCVSGSNPCLPSETCNETTDMCEASACNKNGTCDSGEDCNNCPADCPSGSGASCGNGLCEAGDAENCVNCPADCNGLQGGKPSNRFCCGDGGGDGPLPCSDAACSSGGFACTDTPSVPSCCGDLVCEGSETSFDCPIDCGTPPACGDGTCNGSEDQCNCSDDCGLPPLTESSCTDGIDNDCDTFTDCNDADCTTDPACSCGAKGAPCSVDGDCCSLVCKANSTCR